MDLEMTKTISAGTHSKSCSGRQRWDERSKYQLSLTNPSDALRRGKRAANKGGRSVC